MGTKCIIAALVAWMVISVSCHKQISPSAPEKPDAPEEPIQNLAWNAAQKVYSGMRDLSSIDLTIHLTQVVPSSKISERAASYFKAALENHLIHSGLKLEQTGNLVLSGTLSRNQEDLVFAFTIQKQEQPFLSDSVSIPWNSRVENTLTQFESQPEMEHHHEGHKEMPVPTPLLELHEAPLDVSSICRSPQDASCALLILFADRLVEHDWKQGTERTVPLPVSETRSRAPSGKILGFSNSIVVMNNNMSLPVQFNLALEPVRKELPENLPKPEPGRNDFQLADGHFYDFEYISNKSMAVIDEDRHLEIAEGGTLAKSTELVGASMCVALPSIYTSAPSFPGERDKILKFSYANGALQLASNRSLDGEILDLALTDLNRDGMQELLVTLRNERGIFIEVHEP